MLAVLSRLLLLNYRRAQRWYWELRALDLYRRYGAEEVDFPTVRAILARYRPASVLDLGCGTGRLFPLYTEAGISRIAGVDISERALAVARRAYPRIPTQRIRAEDLPLDPQFDLVVVNRVFQHLPPENLAQALDRVTRIARRLIYLNEIGESDAANLDGARYMFKHAYPALFAARGWRVVEQGSIPAIHQTYLLLEPEPAPDAHSA